MAHQSLYNVNTPTVHHYAPPLSCSYGTFSQTFSPSASVSQQFSSKIYRPQPGSLSGSQGSFSAYTHPGHTDYGYGTPGAYFPFGSGFNPSDYFTRTFARDSSDGKFVKDTFSSSYDSDKLSSSLRSSLSFAPLTAVRSDSPVHSTSSSPDSTKKDHGIY